MNKKGLTLSINMIVIIILAVFTLMVALGFITGVFDRLLGGIVIPDLEYDPTIDDPVSFNPSAFVRGKDKGMAIGYYNNEDAAIDNTVKPNIACEGIENIEISVMGVNIEIGKIGKYEAVVKIPTTTPKGQYSCQLTISETQEPFIMEVK